MKNIVMLTLCFAIFVTKSMHAQSSADDKNELANKLMQVTQADQTAPTLIGIIINDFKKKAYTIPDWYWEEIRNEIPFGNFNHKVKQVYLKNYTNAELASLIKLYKPETMDAYKDKSKKVDKQLYQLGNEFGQEVVIIITEKLKAYKG